MTTLWLTAGLFHEMVERRSAGLRPLRQLLAGGDVLQPRRCGGCCRELPGAASDQRLRSDGEHDVHGRHGDESERGEVGAPVPIGRPIAGTRVYVLDGELASGRRSGCRESCWPAARAGARVLGPAGADGGALRARS